VFAQFVVVNLAAVVFFFQSGGWSAVPRIAAALLLVVTLASLGGLLDRRGWASWLEVGRLLLATVAAPFLWSSAVAVFVAAASAVSLFWLLRLRSAIRPAADVARAA
jgi:hypothetical protein